MLHDHVIVMGHGAMPGGMEHNPPRAVGLGDWDFTGGLAGQGGKADLFTTASGSAGAVRIIKPGHY